METNSRRYTAKRANKFDGKCCDCSQLVPAGTGVLFRAGGNSGPWITAHKPRVSVSPTGPWDKWDAYETGGCPS